ncbi:SET domain-containing protein [Mycena kentingensis (nom. inval.)]|nr:SET domain-containing protein [Mycena kentingensis (nom. inval.)]
MSPSDPPLSYVAGKVVWRPTKIMTNARDLSRDDDFLSHLLVEKLGTGTVPLLVHKMDSSRRLPKTDADDILRIVRRLVATKGVIQATIRQAVDELLMYVANASSFFPVLTALFASLGPIRYYLRQADQRQINAFATHATRYFELYHPSGCIEIAHTSRYSHKTGKSELCILATRALAPGTVITELKGSMANLSDEEDRDLKRTDLRNSDIRRDFSVIHSKQMKKNHLFLGPARFVNHDCNNNCELFREGKYITFRVLRPIAIGEEITAHYGDGYFGKKNRHCLCESCEKAGKGWYAPDHTDEDPPLSSDSESDSSSDSDSDKEIGLDGKPPTDLNVRRTRRGVYATMPAPEDSDESENEAEDPEMARGPGGEIELVGEVDTVSDLTSLPSSRAQSNAAAGPSSRLSPLTALSPALTTRSSSALSSADDTGLSSSNGFRSIISTRGQKAPAEVTQLITPPPSENPDTPKRMTRSVSAKVAPTGKSTPMGKSASQSVTPAPTPTGKTKKGKEKEVVKEETERTLRARPSGPAAPEPAKEATQKPEPPRDADGKLLPICSTCSNILPVISVDSQVVWGLEASGRKKKKQDCPRCLRHFEIYGEAWPVRLSADGPSYTLPTPAEDTTPAESSSRKISKKALSVLDRKLAAAAAAASSKRKGDDEDTRPLKRRKTEPIPRVEPSKPRLSRHSLSTPASKPHFYGKGKRAASSSSSSSGSDSDDEDDEEEEEPPIKAAKSPPKPKTKAKQPPPPLPVLSRAQRAEEREKVRRWLARKTKAEAEDDEEESASTGRKRSSAELEDHTDNTPKRKVARNLPLQRVIPRPSSSFRGGQLGAKPNPLNYALQAWASPLVSTSSSEDDLPPTTPEDEIAAEVVRTPEIQSAPASVSFKPTPFNFARRRWAPQDVVDTRKPAISRPSSPMSEASIVEIPALPTYTVARRPEAGPRVAIREVLEISSDSEDESDDDSRSPIDFVTPRTPPPPSSPLLLESADSSPLPLLRKASPISSPLSSLASLDDDEIVVLKKDPITSMLVPDRDSPLTISDIY